MHYAKSIVVFSHKNERSSNNLLHMNIFVLRQVQKYSYAINYFNFSGHDIIVVILFKEEEMYILYFLQSNMTIY